MAKGVDVDAMHPDGVSALMYAAAGGHPEVVGLLLKGEGKAKADPNLKHVQGGTALMEAATSGSKEVRWVLSGKRDRRPRQSINAGRPCDDGYSCKDNVERFRHSIGTSCSIDSRVFAY